MMFSHSGAHTHTLTHSLHTNRLHLPVAFGHRLPPTAVVFVTNIWSWGLRREEDEDEEEEENREGGNREAGTKQG